MREYKAIVETNIKSESSGRVRTGIAGVFGNVDSVKDRLIPGAFARTINNNLRVKHYWNHDHAQLPIAKILELRELSKAELPKAVLEKAPDATGGLLVKREYLKSAKAEEVLEAIDAGLVNEMSFAYDVIRSENVKHETKDGDTIDVRELQEVSLFDTSDVNWGANSATVALGAKSALGPYDDLEMGELPIGAIAAQLKKLHQAVKSGHRDLSFNKDLLEYIHDTARQLGAVCNSELSAKDDPAPVAISNTAHLLKRNRAQVNDLKLFLAKL